MDALSWSSAWGEPPAIRGERRSVVGDGWAVLGVGARGVVARSPARSRAVARSGIYQGGCWFHHSPSWRKAFQKARLAVSSSRHWLMSGTVIASQVGSSAGSHRATT